MNMQGYLLPTIKVVNILESQDINPVVYGSVGVSLYLGEFKDFNDIDLLIDDPWLEDRWDEFKKLMARSGFSVTDEREHECVE